MSIGFFIYGLVSTVFISLVLAWGCTKTVEQRKRK